MTDNIFCAIGVCFWVIGCLRGVAEISAICLAGGDPMDDVYAYPLAVRIVPWYLLGFAFFAIGLLFASL